MRFECSAAVVQISKEQLCGLEDMLLWQYRREYGGSTLLNPGRFHPGYTKSRNRSSGERGAKLPRNESNPAGGSSAEPLPLEDKPIGRNWMGLDWSVSLKFQMVLDVPTRSGLYKVADVDEGETLVCRTNQSSEAAI
jgi:hypothetical protein